ncbi:LysR family transcriptional regulator [Paraburkholderia phosphatilytica]|uniref:LysR family transcriptional regulator n=1 Tax=Paraburkholderia phosphatilytica TaxID=2282883 RepID=UPI000E50ADAF|nr:LysR family transcriptional regulator [Paraburkholderia phosphatilytica]
MDLAALTDFNAVALYGGFGPASRALGRPKATLSRHVAELEESLGVRLIERGARRLRLTDEGRALHERTNGLIAEIDEAGEAIASRAPVARGRLRVSAPVVLSHVLLCRIAARFAAAYPQVELELVAEDRIVDPVEDGYDVVIRVNPLDDERLVGRRIFDDRRVLVGLPGVALPTDAAASSSDGAAPEVSAVVLSTARPEAVWRFRTPRGDVAEVRPVPVLRLSSLLMVREAVLEGAGVAMLPHLLTARDIAEGRLVLLGEAEGPAVAIWALYSSRRLVSAKVRAFLDMLPQVE